MRLFIKKNILRIGLINITLLASFGLKACESQCLLNVADFTRLLPIRLCHIMQQFAASAETKYKNVLVLGGDPGAGKSTIAREFAKQTNSLPIIINTSTIFSSGTMGSGVKIIEENFDKAEKHINKTRQRAVIIFEEIDAIAIPIQNASNNEVKSAYQAFDVLVDKYKENKKLFIIGTTNRFELCAKEFKDRCEYIHIDPFSRGEFYLAFKAMLMNWPLGKIERAAIAFGKEAASWRQLVTLSDDVIAALDATDIDTIKIDGFIHEGRSILKTLDDEKTLADFEQAINDLEAYYLNNDFRDKKHKLSEFKKQNERLRREYAATATDLEKILNDMVFKIKGINQKRKDDESVKIIDQEIANLSEFIRHETSIFLAGCAKILRTELRVLRQYYDLYFDEAKIKVLLAGHEDKSIRFFDSLFSTLDYHIAQSDLTDQTITTVRAIMEQSDNDLKKAKNSSDLENFSAKTGLFGGFFNNPKYRDVGIVALGITSHIGKVPWPHISRDVLSVLGNSIFPLAVIGDNLYELFLTIKDCAIKGDRLSPGDHVLFNYYKKKGAFLDKMASIRLNGVHKAYFETLQKRSERGLEEAKRGNEIAKKKEQKINKERKKLADEQLELDEKIGKLRRELEAKYGEVT